jgi:hypothetical protein
MKAKSENIVHFSNLKSTRDITESTHATNTTTHPDTTEPNHTKFHGIAITSLVIQNGFSTAQITAPIPTCRPE